MSLENPIPPPALTSWGWPTKYQESSTLDKFQIAKAVLELETNLKEKLDKSNWSNTKEFIDIVQPEIKLWEDKHCLQAEIKDDGNNQFTVKVKGDPP